MLHVTTQDHTVEYAVDSDTLQDVLHRMLNEGGEVLHVPSHTLQQLLAHVQDLERALHEARQEAQQEKAGADYLEELMVEDGVAVLATTRYRLALQIIAGKKCRSLFLNTRACHQLSRDPEHWCNTCLAHHTLEQDKALLQEPQPTPQEESSRA